MLARSALFFGVVARDIKLMPTRRWLWHEQTAPSPPNTFHAAVFRLFRFRPLADYLIWIGNIGVKVLWRTVLRMLIIREITDDTMNWARRDELPTRTALDLQVSLLDGRNFATGKIYMARYGDLVVPVLSSCS
ncbi:hypothetical protein F5I97DRAFT_1826993 [Phlebopus sp. FC_14]|nr:hypothetical protein F5I97DRAFT_1826993 [Phlebopus sp. FC_14]